MGKGKQKRGKKLVYLLSSLNKQEIKDFRLYLGSPLLSHHPQFVRILDILEKKVLNKGLDYTPEEIFIQELSPHRPMDNKRLKYIWTRLYQFQDTLLEFIAFQEYKKDRASQNQYLLQGGIARDLDQVLPAFYQKAIKDLKEPAGGKEFLQRSQLEETYTGYLGHHAKKASDLNLKEVLAAMDEHFILKKLKYACAAINLKLIWGEEQIVDFLDQVLEKVGANPTQFSPVIVAYFHTYKMIQDLIEKKESEHYRQVLFFLLDVNSLSREETQSLFPYLQNYFILQVYNGHKEYLHHLKELYDHVLKHKILLENDLLPSRFFKNTIMLMCRFGELDPMAIGWAWEFWHSFKDQIQGSDPEVAMLYNQAVLHFYEKEYSKTVSILYHQIGRFEEVLYGIDSRFYLCRALWEQKEWDRLAAMTHALRQYVRRRSDLSAAEKSLYTKYARYFERLTKAKTGSPDKVLPRMIRIREDLEAANERTVYASIAKILDREI